MVRTFLSVLLGITIVCHGHGNDPQISEFLYRYGYAVDDRIIDESFRYFLDPYYKKGRTRWYKAMLVTHHEGLIGPIPLKYDLVRNSVYVRHDQKIHRVSTNAIQGFRLLEGSGERVFLKGFGLPGVYEITFSIERDGLEVSRFLLEYPDWEEFRIRSFRTQLTSSEGQVMIRVESATEAAINDLRVYLKADERIQDVKVAKTEPQLVSSTYLEVLVEGPSWWLLKQHAKSISRDKAVSLIDAPHAQVFHREHFFMASNDKELHSIILTRSSVNKGLAFLGLETRNKLPIIPREKHLLGMMRELR